MSEVKNINQKSEGDCGYVCLYKGNQYGVYATSTYAAQTKLAKHLKVSPKKQYEISVYLAEKEDGSAYAQPTTL
jgi:hypothetical protein